MVKNLSASDFNAQSKTFMIVDKKGDGITSDDQVIQKKGAKASSFLDQNVSHELASFYVTHLEALAPASTHTKGTLQLPAMVREAFLRDPNSEITLKEGSILVTGKNLRLPGSVILDEGTVGFKGNQWFVPAGSKAVLNGVEIRGGHFEEPNKKYPIPLFFDGKRRSEPPAYVSLNPVRKELRLQAGENSFSISFRQNNPFVDSQEATDSLTLAVNSGAIWLENRNEKKLIPKLTLQTDERNKGQFTILNGILRIHLVPNNIERYDRFRDNDPRRLQTTSVPIEVQTPVLREQHDLFFTNFNELEKIDRTNFDEKKLSLANNAPITAAELKELKKRVGVPINSANTTPYTATESGVARALDQLKKTAHPNLFKFIKEIRIADGGPLDAFCEIKGAVGCANPDTHKITLNIKTKAPLVEVIIHEAAHILTYKYDEAHETMMGKIEEIKKNKTLSAERKAIMIGELQRKDFITLWDRAEKDTNGTSVYGRYQNPKAKPGTAEVVGWNDAKTENFKDRFGPKHGCLNSYGGTNRDEDIAVFVQSISTNPSEIRLLLDPQTPDYDPRFLKKVKLLFKFGFLTQEQYQNVLSPTTELTTR